MEIPLRTIFNTIALTMHLIEHGVGVNAWRQKVKKGLLPPNHLLRSEGTFPHSKPTGHNRGDKNGIWNQIHMVILIPAIRNFENLSRDKKLESQFLEEDKAKEYIFHLDTLRTHIAQHKECKKALENIQKNGLPESVDDLPTVYKQLLGNEVQSNANHLLGRVIQAFYANKTGDYEGFGLPPEAKGYFEGGKYNVFERTLIYATQEITRNPLYPDIEIKSLSQGLRYYAWLSCPSVVEMITPKFTGAASQAAGNLNLFLDFIHDKTGVDIRNATPCNNTVQQLRENKHLLMRLNLMEQFFTDHANAPEIAALNLDLTPIADLKATIWPECKM